MIGQVLVYKVIGYLDKIETPLLESIISLGTVNVLPSPLTFLRRDTRGSDFLLT